MDEKKKCAKECDCVCHTPPLDKMTESERLAAEALGRMLDVDPEAISEARLQELTSLWN